MHPHSLTEKWVLWVNGGRDEHRKLAGRRMLCSIGSVEEFWQAMTHLKPITEINDEFAEFQFFKSGVKPVENDPHNARGGQWILRIRRAADQGEGSLDHLLNVARTWEHLLIAVIGGSFSKDRVFSGAEIQGAVFSVFPDEFWISVWNKTAPDPTIVNAIKEALYQTLETQLAGLGDAVFEYLPHIQALEGPKQVHRHRSR